MADNPSIIAMPSGSAEIRDQWLQDVRLSGIQTGVEDPPIEPGTDLYLIGEANSQVALVGLANIQIASKDTNVLDATGEALDAIREGDGLPVVATTGSTGKIRITVAGPTTITNGTVAKLPSGLRIRTVGPVVNPADQQEINVEAIDTGSLTNAKGGTVVQFVVAPTNVQQKAIVSTEFPLSNGTDAETDARKRDRILNTRRNKPAAGNWAYWRQFVQDRYGSIADTYVYCAPGGPSSNLIVPMRGYDRANNDYSRAPSDALIQTIRNAVQADSNGGIETVVRPPADQLADFTLLVEIPSSSLAGGNGQGWTDAEPWPSLEVSDGGRVTITTVVSDNDELTLNADTATEPLDGQTQVAWWSREDRLFYTALVVGHSGSSGAWVIDLDRPLVGKDGVGPQAGDFVCPNAQNLAAYGATWVALLESLGPGEITDDADRLPRALRNPNAADEDPYSVNNATLTQVTRKHAEITDVEFGYAPATSPTVPASVDDPPNVFVPRNFAVYPAP